MKYRGYTVNISIDNHATNPRKWLNLGTLITCDTFNEVDKNILEDVTDAVSKGSSVIVELSKYFGNIVACLPIYEKYSMMRNEELLGFMFATELRARCWFDTYNIEREPREVINKTILELVKEIKEIEHYVKGWIYSFNIVEMGYNGSGFLTYNDCAEEAKSIIDHEKGVTDEYKRLFEQIGKF